MLLLLAFCLLAQPAAVGGLRFRSGDDVEDSGADDPPMGDTPAEMEGTLAMPTLSPELRPRAADAASPNTEVDLGVDVSMTEGAAQNASAPVDGMNARGRRKLILDKYISAKVSEWASGTKRAVRDVASVPEYLANIYKRCRQIDGVRASLPYISYSELRSRYAPPALTYAPYVTNIPVMYITVGGERLKKFQGIFRGFSPNMVRVDAFAPVGSASDERELGKLVESPAQIIGLAKNQTGDQWQKVLGCLVSHLKAIQTAFISGTNVVMIVEDDAMPMYPTWRSSLEEFVISLPEEWEAVQLQWTSGLNTSFYGKHHNMNASGKTWAAGHAWGTAAYLLHRRAIGRIMARLWNREAGKFQLTTLARKCPMMSADDCLLGFTGFPEGSSSMYAVKWFPGHSKPLTQVYLTTPTMFLHDSTNNLVHIKNYCQDIRQNKRLFRQREAPAGAERLLLFFAVNSSRTASGLGLKTTVSNLRRQGFHVFLAWDQLGYKYLNTNSRKINLLGRAWKTYGEEWQRSYDYIWAFNEDLAIDTVDLVSALKMVAEANAGITAPTLDDASPSWDAPFRQFQKPSESCRLRYTNFVEDVAPVFKTKVLGSIFAAMAEGPRGDLDATSALGLDLVWCRYVQPKLAQGERPCALLDNLTLFHNDSLDLMEKSHVKMKKQVLRKFFRQHSTHLVNDGVMKRGQDLTGECVSKPLVHADVA